ncbi:MAG: TetR family transcriptional regulator [Devosia sp.]
MPTSRPITREAIVKQAMKIISRKGASAVTFQALAGAFDVSKQAIIYWYPTKWALVADICLPFMRAETEALLPAIAESRNANDAIGRLVRTFVGHYMDRLPQFRLLYLPDPLGVTRPNARAQQAALAPVHALTSSVYKALEDKLAADMSYRSGVSPRRAAVAVHMAAVGLVTMFAAADALGDPMVHAPRDMVDALTAVLLAKQ